MDKWVPPFSRTVARRARVPGSKSEANRALLLAALAQRPSRVDGVPEARDTDLMAQALTSLGATIHRQAQSTIVAPPQVWRGGADVDCGLAGTVMRFVPPLAMLADGPTRFHGDPRASERPMAPLLDGLRALGAVIDADALPFTLTPPHRWQTSAVVDASLSSQFVSGMLLAAARYPKGLALRVNGELPSRPHVDMTVAMLRARGVEVQEPEPGYWIVQAGRLAALDTVVEPDLTNAAAFLLAGVMTAGWAEIAGWPETTVQPGAAILGIIERFGGWWHRVDGAVRAGADGPLTAADCDLRAASELTPVVAALAAVAQGRTRLTGIGHIRGHETDRIAAIVEALDAVGVPARGEPDGLIIDGGGPRHGGTIDSRDDHRLVHLGALLGLVTSGVVVLHPAAVAKTMPDFVNRWQELVS